MALEPQIFSFSLVGGMDTKTDPKQLNAARGSNDPRASISSKVRELHNAVFITTRTYRKRNGYGAFGTDIEGAATGLTTGVASGVFKSELLTYSGTTAYSFNEATNKQVSKGGITSCDLTVTQAVRNTYNQTTCDVAYHSSGLYVYTYEDSRGGSRYSVIDANTNQLILADGLILSTAVKAKPIAIGVYILIFYINTANGHLVYKAINSTTPLTLGASVDVSTTVNATDFNYDAALLSDRVFLAWNDSAGGGAVSIKYINSFLTQSNIRSQATEVANPCINVAVDTGTQYVWVSYYDGTNVRYFIYDYSLSLTPILVPTTIEAVANIRNICVSVTSGVGSYFYEKTAGATYNYQVLLNQANSAGTVTGGFTSLRSVGLASKPFIYNSDVFVLVAYQSTLQPTYFLIDFATRIFGKLAPGNGGGLTAKSILSEALTLAGNSYVTAYLQKDLLTTVTGAVYTQTGVQGVTFDFDSLGTYQQSEVSNNLHISGALLNMYDGNSFVEHGFNLYPENVACSTNTAGGNILAGTYQYSIVYEWMDNQGQMHQSAPSIPVTQVTTGSTTTNTLTIPTLRLTEKKAPTRAPVSIAVYRTAVNATTFYRLNALTSPLLNVTTSDTVTYVDTAVDTAIMGNPLLYTTGGVLENISVPACFALSSYRNRLLALLCEDRFTYWYSFKATDGVPIAFNDGFFQKVDQRGGELTGVAEMDDKIILYKKNSIFYSNGDGPTATGAQNDFITPELITTDGGTENHRSIVLTPLGLMYQSTKGFYLLSRALQASYVGADVEAYNNDVVTSAQLVPNTNEVRFTLESGVALTYDYLLGQWSIFDNIDAIDSTIFQNKFTYLKDTGTSLQETIGSYSDNGQFIKVKFVTGWLSFAGLQAFQRVYRMLILGQYKSEHRLLIQVAYDYNEAFVNSAYVDAADLCQVDNYGDDAYYGAEEFYGGQFTAYQFQYNFVRQKCTAIKISIEDVQVEGLLGESSQLSSIAFEVGMKKGLNMLENRRSVG